MKTETIKDIMISAIDEIVEDVLEAQYKDYPHLKESYSPRQLEHAKEDAKYNIQYLANAIELKIPEYFSHYISWLQSILVYRGQSENILKQHLEYLKDILVRKIPDKYYDEVIQYLDLGLNNLKPPFGCENSLIIEENPLKELAQEYLDKLLNNSRFEAISTILKAEGQGVSIEEIFLNVLQPVQQEIGRLWQINEISVAQEHYCTAITQQVISNLYFKIFDSTKKDKTLVSTCIAGELHEIGIRMITDIFELRGWDTYFLGSNTPIKDIISMIKDKKPDILAISATMMMHIPDVNYLIEKVKELKISNLKIMVGGFPFNFISDLWKRVGADGGGNNLENAIQMADKLVD